MSGITYDYMEQYIRNLIPDSTGKFSELEAFAKENGVPIAQKETIKFLEFMVSMKKPLRILELGTAIGYSAIKMYEAAGTEPHITTVERSEEMINLAKENIKSFNLENKIEIKEGDCLEILEALDEPYDLIFMDAGKGHYNHFLPHCLRLLKEDGIIIADNMLYRGRTLSDYNEHKHRTATNRLRKYLVVMKEDKRLDSTLIKIGDGLAISIVKK